MASQGNPDDDPRPLAESSSTLMLVLDVDDTLLKEVSIEHRADAAVQLITYKPSPDSMLRFRQRLEARANESVACDGNDSSKVVHYEIHGDIVNSAVVVRPSMVPIIDGLVAAGCRTLLLASANDEPRTAAVCSELRLRPGGPTLAQIGFKAVPRTVCMAPAPTRNEQKKDIAAVRAWSKADGSCKAIILDDKHEHLVNLSSSDYLPVDCKRGE